MKKVLFFAITILVSAAALADQKATEFLDVARDGSGKVIEMTKSNAVEYCKSKGAHLPSARELAQFPRSLGAWGISGYRCGSTEQTCYLVSDIQNADGSKDEFYYSYSEYSRPDNDLGHNWFWSSSVNSKNSSYAIGLSGYYGQITYLRFIKNAVLCVVGK